jgi:transposase-like protein
MMRKAEENRRWSMTLPPKKKRRVVPMERLKERRPMEKPEKPKVGKPGMEGNKRGRKVSDHTAAEKCHAVLSVWTEKRRLGEVCRELGVAWSSLNQWQNQAMEGMLMALQPRVVVDKDVALNPRLVALLERKIKGGVIKGLDRRLAKLQGSPVVKPGEMREAAAEKKS